MPLRFGFGVLLLAGLAGAFIFLWPLGQTVTGVTASGATVSFTCDGTKGCCCNTVTSTNNSATPSTWDPCAQNQNPPLDCVAMRPGGVPHPTAGIIDVNVCMPATPVGAPPALASNQPTFCRIDLVP